MRSDARHSLRVQRIAAMERRTARLDGEARRVLEARLEVLRAQLRADAGGGEDAPVEAATPPPGPLAELVGHIASETTPERAAYPELPALDDFRNLWSGIRADSRLQQAVAQVPTDAGPLNSAALARRSIALMRELSPGYLRSFLAYVDELAWLEQVGSAGPATRAVAAKKRASRRPRR